jgi:WD40 repeat protein
MKIKVLLILTFAIVCFFSQSAHSQMTGMQTILLEGPPETSIAWSHDSLEIAIGTDQGIFFINATTGKITDRFTYDEFGYDRSPQYILSIDWSPDGTKLAIVGKPEVTVHYPTDVWIIDRNDRTAKRVTNSTLYSIIAEDEEVSIVRSIYYNSAKWTSDGLTILLGIETVDQFFSKINDGSINTQYINTICTLDPETEEMKDYQGVLPLTKTSMTPEQVQSLLSYPDNLYESYFSPNGRKVVLKTPQPGDNYGFILKNLQK